MSLRGRSGIRGITFAVGASLGMLLLPSGVPSESADELRVSGYEAFGQGTLGDSGANLYVSRNGRVQVINHLNFVPASNRRTARNGRF
jgi:hypothetical protein